jgi:hypothetical protein
MLVATRRLYGASVEGSDGRVGTVKDLLFDGRSWKVRYVDVDTGHWLPGRRVILSPTVVRTADYANQRLAVPLTRQQVEASPPLEAEMPVSRQKEMELARYYAWGTYWANLPGRQQGTETEQRPNLRSTGAVSGYHIQAIDGEIGHVADFIMDDEAWDNGPWEIRYLVIDTRNWLPGRHVLIPPLWAESIDWDTRKVEVGLTRELIERSPDYDPDEPVNRRYEEVLYDYYGRPRYWAGTGHAV